VDLVTSEELGRFGRPSTVISARVGLWTESLYFLLKYRCYNKQRCVILASSVVK
jgi:hypothetical protein